MKYLILILALLLPIAASESRQWTQAATGRTITGKMTDKLDDDSKAKIVTAQGKTHWLVAADLIEEDQEYIRDWMPAVDHLTVRVSGSGKGYKTLTITVIAGRDPLKLIVSPSHPSRDPITRDIPARETEEFEFKVYPEYTAKVLDPDGTVIDSEKWNQKTGL